MNTPALVYQDHTIVVYPECPGQDGLFYAIVYPVGSRRQAIWETARYETVERVCSAAKSWIDDQYRQSIVSVPCWVNRIVHWECPACGTHLTFNDQASGSNSVCPSCGNQFLVHWTAPAADVLIELLH